jgi:hypothetical protein
MCILALKAYESHLLHWQPRLRTDANGEAQDSFFLGLEASAYRVVVEGFGSGGLPGEGSHLILPSPLSSSMPACLPWPSRVIPWCWPYSSSTIALILFAALCVLFCQLACLGWP